MANIEIETGYQLLTRLTTRPSLENVYPDLFVDGPFKQQIIEISGNSSTGKTLLITEIIANCLLPDCINNIQGKNSGVIFINTDHHFSIFKLVNIMKMHLQKDEASIKSQQINDIITESLKNLIVLNCFDSQQFYLTFQNLEKIISNNLKLSIVIVDSISSFYWSDRIHGGIKKVDSYQKTILRSLQNITRDYKLVIMYTKTTNISKGENINIGLESANYKIRLDQTSDEEKPYIANIILPDNSTITKYFKISDLIIWL